MPHFIAIDLGATSGRTILASIDKEGKLSTEEINRFPNRMMPLDGHMYWNIYSLFDSIKEGLALVARKGIVPQSIGIDTWGVDFVCIADDGTFAGLPHAYRDPQYSGSRQRFFNNVMSADDLYNRAGIQHLDFNTVFQFNELKDTFAMRNASKIAFTPDALAYMLTGKLVTEYTIASTGSILNPWKRDFDVELIERVGISRDKFGPLTAPATVIGKLKRSIADETGLHEVPVVAVAGHDTASAVAAVPAKDSNFAYLSSGTWSLMGIESPVPVINDITRKNNITNEGGVESTVRVLKNITGMWIVEQCLQSWKKQGISYSYPEMVALAEAAPEFKSFINPDDPSFVCPSDMPAAIIEYCNRTGQEAPETHGEFLRIVFESLALTYRSVLDIFRSISQYPIERLHVIGGGSRNRFLNKLTANALGIPVMAGPAEATAIGNIMLQAKACGLVSSLTEMREIIARNIEIETFNPTDSEKWEQAFNRFEKVIK